jgi:heme exporter protein A
LLDFDTLTVRDISKHFGRRRALARISLTCAAGRIVGLLGPNGAGKSTLLSILATLMAPSSGEVRYGTYTAAAAGSQLRARLGLLAHDLHLYGDLTARENLEFFARLYGVAEPRERVSAALVHAGLAGRADDRVGGFSRGMRQRLALERALLHRPRLLLLDEPFTGLDDASTAMLLARLRALAAERTIVLLATHDLDVAESLLDEVTVLRDGRIAAAGPALSGLRQRYRDWIAESEADSR